MSEGRTTLYLLIACAALWGGIVLFQSGENISREIYERTVTDSEIEEAAREQLAGLQAVSFAEDTEYCGLLAENADGEIVSRTVIVGDHESCDITYFNVRTLFPLATYHTHAGFNPDYDSEVPSLIDMESDIASGMDGFIATPGGRFWKVDASRREARQLCGAGCLPSDPDYHGCTGADPLDEYTLAALEQRARTVWTSC